MEGQRGNTLRSQSQMNILEDLEYQAKKCWILFQ